MRIGIYLGETDETVGGGHTFFESIIQQLCSLSSCRHQFTLLAYSKDLLKHFSPYPDFIDTCVLKHIEYKPSLLEKLSNRIRSPKLSFPSPITEQAKERKLQLMWYITSHTGPLDIPYFYTVWDLQHRQQAFFPEVSSNGEWEAREKKLREVICRAAFILSGTQRGKSEISLYYNISEERIKLLPHPTPTFALSGLKADNKVFDKVGFSSNYLFYPAQFWAHKNHIVILKALQELNRKGKKYNTIFTGSDKGNLVYIKSRIQEYDLEGQVKILGFVSREELIALYENALALVYPTYFGPENLPPLEAFALGCPVIASSVPGSEEQLADNALLFNPADYLQVVEKILVLSSNNSLRQELIATGKIRSLQYTTSHYVNDIISLFDTFEPLRDTWRF